MNRPPHVAGAVERRQVEAMAGYGLSEADIACVLDIDAPTLRLHYRREIEIGQIVANAKVAESLFRKATGDHRQAPTAAIFWLKTRARWREATGQETDRDTPPVQIEAMSDTELARRIAFLDRLLEEAHQQAGADPVPPGERDARDQAEV